MHTILSCVTVRASSISAGPAWFQTVMPCLCRRGIVSLGPRMQVGWNLSRWWRHAEARCRLAAWWAAVLLGLTFTLTARGHDPGISMAQMNLRAGALEITTGFAPADVELLLPAQLRTERIWTEVEFEAARDQLRALAPKLWSVEAGGSTVPPRETRVELLPGDNVSFHLVYSLPPRAAEKLTLRSPKVLELPPAHRQFVIVSDERGSMLTRKLLSARDVALEVPLGGAATPAGEPSGESNTAGPTFWEFVKLGVVHIWLGYDHLLFLFALLVVCRSFRSIVTIITCFTVAHSLTLALATLDVVRLPGRLVEAAIAASIVFVGVENLWRRGEEPAGRWALTFAFGLVHGFGFATVLRELGVGQSNEGIVLPLFAFNAGVELGQVAIAGVVLPLVWWLRRNEAFVRRGVPALSALVAIAGSYWLVQRTVFG